MASGGSPTCLWLIFDGIAASHLERLPTSYLLPFILSPCIGSCSGFYGTEVFTKFCFAAIDLQWPEDEEALSQVAQEAIEELLTPDPNSRPGSKGAHIFVQMEQNWKQHRPFPKFSMVTSIRKWRSSRGW